jgi:DNA polymerase-3 subunit gamma/tau
MRDAQSALDQVIAFSGTTIGADDVSTVLGLVRRDLLIEIADAVAREDAAAMFDLAARAVEAGYDLRLVIRELARLTRDLLVLTIDPSRASDPEIAADAERDVLLGLAKRFSGEDLMRAFDVLTKAELDIRGSAQPRYHLEMALLRWVHLRKLVPLTDLIEQMQGGARGAVLSRPPDRGAAHSAQPDRGAAGSGPPDRGAVLSGPPPGATRAAAVKAVEARRSAPVELKEAPPADVKEAFLAEIRRAKKFFHGTVVAQAQRIDVEPDRVVFVFAPQHRALRSQLDGTREWLEQTASQLAGRRMAVVSIEGSAPAAAGAPGDATPPAGDRQQALKEQALADSGVQALLDVFAAEIKDVEEM